MVVRRFGSKARVLAAAGIATAVLLGAAGPVTASEVSDAIKAEKRVERRIEKLTRQAHIRGRQLQRAVVVAEREADARPGLQTLSVLEAAQRAEHGFGSVGRLDTPEPQCSPRRAGGLAVLLGIFPVCPVDGPRYIHDDFGEIVTVGDAPPHAHQGSDVEAPTWTPIRAPFDGYAWSSSSRTAATRSAFAGTAATSSSPT